MPFVGLALFFAAPKSPNSSYTLVIKELISILPILKLALFFQITSDLSNQYLSGNSYDGSPLRHKDTKKVKKINI
jgi:hypothetical protein